MKITFEVTDKAELEKIMKFFGSLDNEKVTIIDNTSGNLLLNMIPGDKSIDPNELFGIWADDPRSAEDIRKAAWERK